MEHDLFVIIFSRVCSLLGVSTNTSSSKLSVIFVKALSGSSVQLGQTTRHFELHEHGSNEEIRLIEAEETGLERLKLEEPTPS